MSATLSGKPCWTPWAQIVALGNLLPVDVATDELDSWMFQTVGHQLVEAYAACTGLPLLRRCISGASRNTVRSFAIRGGSSSICCNLAPGAALSSNAPRFNVLAAYLTNAMATAAQSGASLFLSDKVEL